MGLLSRVGECNLECIPNICSGITAEFFFFLLAVPKFELKEQRNKLF